MENASKALLIAGGVLIAMLVLSLGVYFARTYAEHTARIYQQMENSKRTEFNQQFIKYDGMANLNIQDVATLINLAKDSNEVNGLTIADKDNDKSLYVTVKINVTNTTFDVIQENAEQLDTNDILKEEMLDTLYDNYKCTVKYNQNTGYVNYIEIN